MNFSELVFIARFLPLLLVIYYVTPHRWKNLVLLLASLGFNLFLDVKTCIVLGAFILINFPFLKGFDKVQKNKKKGLFICLLIMDSLPLICFKFWPGLGGLMPVGLSFYTFMLLSVVCDVYWGRVRVSGLLEFSTYMSFFGKVLQGPIVLYEEMQEERKYTVSGLEYGMELFIVGLMHKVLVADRIAILWNDVQMIGFESISTPMAYLGMAAFCIQLYFDFNGYSLMAMGVAKMLGIDFPRNFDHPYMAATVGEYYRRWHATLGRWFKEYVYIPLGGSRVRAFRHIFNLFVVWLFTGLWHGTTVNFLIWAGMLLVLICLEKFLYGKFLEKHFWISRIYIFTLIPLSWIVFAIPNLQGLIAYVKRLLPWVEHSGAVNARDYIHYGKDFIGVFLLAFVLSLPIVEKCFKKFRSSWWMKLILFVAFWVCIYVVANNDGNPFLYSNF